MYVYLPPYESKKVGCPVQYQSLFFDDGPAAWY